MVKDIKESTDCSYPQSHHKITSSPIYQLSHFVESQDFSRKPTVRNRSYSQIKTLPKGQ